MSLANDIIEYLRGTANSLGDAAQAFGVEEEQVHEIIADDAGESIFECERCNWWCGADEESSEPGVCNDCAEDGEGESDG